MKYLKTFESLNLEDELQSLKDGYIIEENAIFNKYIENIEDSFLELTDIFSFSVYPFIDDDNKRINEYYLYFDFEPGSITDKLINDFYNNLLSCERKIKKIYPTIDIDLNVYTSSSSYSRRTIENIKKSLFKTDLKYNITQIIIMLY